MPVSKPDCEPPSRLGLGLKMDDVSIDQGLEGREAGANSGTIAGGMDLLYSHEGKSTSPSSPHSPLLSRNAPGGTPGPSRSPIALMKRLMTPRRTVLGGILRPPDTPGTGQSVRFGKRLYDDGDESKMSTSTGHSAANSLSASPLPATERLEQEGQDTSADLVEMSLASVAKENDAEGHPYAFQDATKSPWRPASSPSAGAAQGESSSESVGLPALEGYSNLDEISFGLDRSPENLPGDAEASSFIDGSLDESMLRKEASRVKGLLDRQASQFQGKTSARLTQADDNDTREQGHLAGNQAQTWSPMTTTTQASDYKSARSQTSTVSPQSDSEGQSSPLRSPGSDVRVSPSSPASIPKRHASLENLHKDAAAYSEGDHTDFSLASPSALKASRRLGTGPFGAHNEQSLPTLPKYDYSLSNQTLPDKLTPETKNLTNGALMKQPLGGLVRSQTTPSFLSLSFTNSSLSSSSPNLSSTSLTIKEILRAAEELDRAHFERSEVLLRRVQNVEREAADLRHGRARDRAFRESQQQSLKKIEGMIGKLKAQLSNRSISLKDDGNDLFEAIEQHLQATHSKSKGSAIRSSDDEALSEANQSMDSEMPRTEMQHDQSDSRDRLEMVIREELEHDFAEERYKLQRDHENDLQRLVQHIEASNQPSMDIALPNADRARTLQEGKPTIEVQGLQLSSNSVDLHEASADQADAALTELRMLRSANEVLETRAKEVTREREELLELLQDLERKLQTESEARNIADEQLAKLKEELQGQWRYAERAHEAEAKLQDRVHELEDQLEEAVSRVGSASKQIDELEHLKELVEQQEKDRARLDELKSSHQQKLRAIMEKHSGVEGQLSEAIEEAAKISEDLRQQNVRFAEAEDQYKTRINDLEMHLSTFGEERNALQEALRISADQIARLRKSANHIEDGSVAAADAETVGHCEADLAKQNAELSKEVLRLQSELHKATHDARQVALEDSFNANHTAVAMSSSSSPQVRIRALERELGDRGLLIVKLRKAKERLEEDNFNFSIALSAKQQELSYIKRTRCRAEDNTILNTPAVRKSTRRGEHSDRLGLRNALGDTSKHTNQSTTLDDATGDPVQHLQSGPAKAFASRRRISHNDGVTPAHVAPRRVHLDAKLTAARHADENTPIPA